MFSSINNPTEHGLLFFGNQHETVPTRLLQDPCLTPRAKFAWQLIKCNVQAFQGGLFPSYETLSKMLSDRPYAEAKLSEKVVTQTLYLLRLTRWLTLCETVRDERGYVQGNVYILHDEPVPILDAIQLNSDYLSFLDKCTKHKDSLINGVANHIVESLMADKTKWHYVSHLDCLQNRYKTYQQQQQMKDKPLSQAEQELSKIQQNILTSAMEVRDFDEEVRKKSSEILTSNKEVRDENDDKSLILDLLPLGKSDVLYSTLYINKYCTGEPSEITWPQEIPLTSLEQKLTAQAMKGLDLGLCQAILLEAQQRIIQKQDVRKPKGYLYTLIQRAKQGEFKPYY
ncbi:hypothetical protein AC574_09700, partial [Mannheimia haemolytica]